VALSGTTRRPRPDRGTAAALGRFQGRAAEWRADSHGGISAFTPGNCPIVDFIGPNVHAILDSNHGFKTLAMGQQAAADIMGLEAPAPAGGESTKTGQDQYVHESGGT